MFDFTAGTVVALVASVGALLAGLTQWWTAVSERHQVKRDLEILKLLAPDSEEHEMVWKHARNLIWWQYGSLADLRRREIWKIFLYALVGVGIVVWAAVAFSRAEMANALVGSIIAVVIGFWCWINYVMLPE